MQGRSSPMPVYRLGSGGDAVRRIQLRLQALGLYRGAIDGLFGGGTQSAVKQFQRTNGLPIDGVVGPQTWQALLLEVAVPSTAGMASESIEYRCVSLTG